MKFDRDKAIIYWLATGCILVLVMVVVGGITRLTHSGLSMVQWSLLMGGVPPLNENDWMEVFSLYQQTPEFRLENYDFTLQEFRSIFWWEYIHRMIGRLIGLIFILPFIYFLIKRRISKVLLRKLLILLGLGAFQGFMGWYMVKSGLVKDPNVSHYRLASHLFIAFALYGYTFWLLLEQVFGFDKLNMASKKLQNTTLWLLVILLIQVIYGAFVSGLNAGAIYNTFPEMGDSWIAESVPFAFHKDGFISLLENHATVQFIHRYNAYLIIIVVIILWYQARNVAFNKFQSLGFKMVLLMVGIQILLGISTLILAVPISLGVLHQLGALLLLTSIIYFFYQTRFTGNAIIGSR